MQQKLKEIAERTLKFLCVGSSIEGINFYGLKLIISESDDNKNRINGQIYLNIESKFKIYDSWPSVVPREEELSNIEWIESTKILCELRLKRIVDIKLDDEIPHLYMKFETGEVLFVFGHNLKYESWQLGVWSNSNNNEIWDIVCCPGDEIAIWAPDDFVS